MNIEYFVLLFGLLMNIVPILHVAKMVKEKSSSGQSMIAVIILILGFCVWTFYSIHINNSIMITTNIVGLITSMIYLSCILYFKN